MQEEDFPAADRIISHIEAAFRQDPELRDFDVLLSPIDDNTSPVVHIRGEHCLGIKSWCVKPLYKFVYKHLIQLRTNRVHRRQVLTPEDRQRFENLLNVALLLNPEVATFWNLRRELLSRGHLDSHRELQFGTLVSSFKPKASDVFVYRRWILSNILKDLPELDRSQTLSREFEAVYRSASKYANNYNAWNHGLWCLERATFELKRQLLDSSAKWTLSHVSDHSGLQFRQQLLRSVLDSTSEVDWCPGISCKLCPPWYQEQRSTLNAETSKMSDCLIHELVQNAQNIATYPGHEALWCHRRFIVYELGVRGDPLLTRLLQDEETRVAAKNSVSLGVLLGDGVSLGDDAGYGMKHVLWMGKFLLPPL